MVRFDWRQPRFLSKGLPICLIITYSEGVEPLITLEQVRGWSGKTADVMDTGITQMRGRSDSSAFWWESLGRGREIRDSADAFPISSHRRRQSQNQKSRFATSASTSAVAHNHGDPTDCPVVSGLFGFLKSFCWGSSSIEGHRRRKPTRRSSECRSRAPTVIVVYPRTRPK